MYQISLDIFVRFVKFFSDWLVEKHFSMPDILESNRNVLRRSLVAGRISILYAVGLYITAFLSLI